MLISAPAMKAGRATIAFGTALALIVAMFAMVLSSASPAQAAGLLCNGTTIYGLVPDNPAVFNTVTSLVSIDGGSVGNAQLSATLQSRSPVDNVFQNALAISVDGSTAFAAADQGTTVRRLDSATDTWSSFPGRPQGAPGDVVVGGAIDPTTGIYYFGDLGGTLSNPGVGQVFGFDTTTNQMISSAPLLTFPAIAGETNGDIAFDGAGNLYIVTSGATTGELLTTAAPIPRTAAQARQVATTLLSTFPLPAGATASVNGIAFDATGALYLSLSGAATGGVFSIDPGTGTPQSTLTPLSTTLAGPSGTGLVDLASCSFPPSLSVQKNVVSRVNPTDQFTLQATGPSISLPVTATTTGTATGLQQTSDGQTLQAGPALARFNDTYTATETAAGTTDLSHYVTTYSCVDVVNATNPQFPISGTGTTASFTLAPASESPSVVCTFTNEARTPSLALTKTANPTTVTATGDTVTYTFQVTNSGNTTLTGIGVDETAFSGTGTLPAPTCDTTTLDPGESTQCTTTYSATAADIAAGTITNTAVASGQDTGLGMVTSPSASAVVTVTPAVPALALTKTADPGTVTAAGDTVTYTFHVTNTGNVTVDNIAVAEGSFSGTGSVSAITCTATTLVAGASTDCTATYQVSQADIDAGQVINDATATGDDPAGGLVTSPLATATVTATASPALSLTKAADPTTVTGAGQSVVYTFQVTNTGNTTVTSVVVAETGFSGAGSLPAPSCDATSLAPGESTQCTTTYTTTAADMSAATIDNSAVATGLDPGAGMVTSPSASAVVTVTPAVPALALTKTADPGTVTAAGDTVTYTFHVTNTGNVTVDNIAVAEGDFSGTGSLSAITCTATTLVAGASTDCTATYQVSQADIDAGQVINDATATGDDPAGGLVTSPLATATVTATASPALSLTKAADPTTVTGAGQSVVYTFQVTNTGNTTVTSVVVAETGFSGAGSLPAPSCDATSLAPGESTQCTTTYTTTAADMSAATIDNSAVATGLDPGAGMVTSPSASAVVTVTPAVPALALTKTADPGTVTAAGDTVTYTFHVTNTGNVTVDNIAVAEGSFSGTGSVSAITCTATTLVAGASTDCTATYQVSQADIDAGQVINDATATGDDPAGGLVTSPLATATVTATASPALSLTKAADPTSGTAPGDTVTYSFHITNTGNVSITNITVAEGTFTGTGGSPVITCPAGATSLAPGNSAICTAPYVLTQADVDAGHVDNTATATGTDTGNGPVTSNESDVTVSIPPTPALTLKKTASTSTIDAAGQTITYSFRVTNTGNVTLADVAVVEQSFSGTGTPLTLTCPADTTLIAGQSLTCTADYQTTEADFAAGSITNTADATGADPSGSSVTSPESSAVVESAASPTPPVASAPPAAEALAKTGETFPGWLIPLAGFLVLAGAGLTVIVATRNRPKKQGK
ncbi:beta strand repeat-containing protein [Diaminobutyricibacter sp. McL0618]|uniref:beta strand repeat-containing protein n=1 Tax=Leifsonia sp. McL0618 TaxID=3415677 RepID=UPI003CED17E6